MKPKRAMVAALVLLATGCGTAARQGSPVGPVNGAYEDGPAKSVNDDEVLRMLERELNRAFSPGTVSGTIRAWLNIDAEGIVRSVEIAESSGSAELDAVALRVFRHLRYEPARRDGRPVETRIHHSINLRGRSPPR